jgi:PadR family transcriptional regulator, regulatory protein AphA
MADGTKGLWLSLAPYIDPIYDARPFDFAFHKDSGVDVKDPCLDALTLGDASGYDIKKFFENTLSHCYQAGYGSVYPAPANLASGKRLTAIRATGQRITRRKFCHRVAVEHGPYMCAPAWIPQQCNVKPDFLVALHASRLNPRSGGCYDAHIY